MSRPKGSKNKPKTIEQSPTEVAMESISTLVTPVKRKVGRPRKNEPKTSDAEIACIEAEGEADDRMALSENIETKVLKEEFKIKRGRGRPKNPIIHEEEKKDKASKLLENDLY